MKTRLLYEAKTPFGRPPLTDFERAVVAEGDSDVDEACGATLKSESGAEWMCTRVLHKDGKHYACGQYRDIIAIWEEELLQ